MNLRNALKAIILIAAVCVFSAKSQQTNPVDRQVANPITDTPNVNPISPENDITPPKKKQKQAEPKQGGDDELVIYSERETVEGEEGKRIKIYSGNVDVRYGDFRLQADKISLFEEKDLLVAEGNVVFDQGEDQRITGSKGEFNFRTKLGSFVETNGFTNQTNDGTVIYFSADRVERTAINKVTVENGKFTACEETVPKWSFTAKKAVIKADDKVKLKNAKFRVKNVRLVFLPYASIPIKRRDRSSGFLTPTFGSSSNKGFRFAAAYYQTLGRSADITFRADLFSSRGIGFGFDARTRADSRSFFNFGFYAVKDRIFGAKTDAEHPDQGGSSAYAEGVQFFPKGFTAVANVRLYSNLAFRQVFSDGIQQIISPIEVSQVYVNKSWDEYSFNVLARSQVISIPNARIKIRNLPGINFEKRPSPLPFLKNVYFSFKTNLDRVVRRESIDDLTIFRRFVDGEPMSVASPALRFDAYPQISVPFNFKYFSLVFKFIL